MFNKYPLFSFLFGLHLFKDKKTPILKENMNYETTSLRQYKAMEDERI
jgi:hypothetical protein